jgi:hypothetical protein
MPVNTTRKPFTTRKRGFTMTMKATTAEQTPQKKITTTAKPDVLIKAADVGNCRIDVFC